MAQKKLSQYPSASSVVDADVVPIIQSGANKKATRAQIVAGLATAQSVTDEATTRTGADTVMASDIATLQTSSGDLASHVADAANPHSVTKTQVGLGSADDTSDADKPISDAVALVFTNKQPLDSDLTAIAALSTTAFGRALLESVDASALRTAASLGNSATKNTGTSSGDVATGNHGHADAVADVSSGFLSGALRAIIGRLAITATKTASFLNSLSFTGRDGDTIAFPAPATGTTANVAATNAANDFSQPQTISFAGTSVNHEATLNNAMGHRAKNNSSGGNAQLLNSAVNNSGYTAWYGITSSAYSAYTPTANGRAFYMSNNVPVVYGTQSNTDAHFFRSLTEWARIGANGWFLGGGGTATAKVHLAAGGSAANSAALKLTPGSLLSTPENGAIEFDGTNVYITIGGVRKTVTLT